VSRLICVFLMLFLPLQGFAMQVGSVTPGTIYNLAHELEHSEGVSHHHEDDGSVHYDDSVESESHLADCSIGHHYQPGLPASLVFALPDDRPVALAEDGPAFIPDPVPQRPQRPPSASLA
jgi:hypothetical protein